MKYRYWRSILWMPTWLAFAFLRRLSTLEAVISLPGRPFSRPVRRMVGGAGTAEDRSRQGFCRCRPGQAMTV